MPPRLAAIAIILGWLAAVSWFIYEEWSPYFRTDYPPSFTVELADEAAPLVANWGIWRNDQRIGTLTTKLTIQRDDTFELHSSVDNLEIVFDELKVKLRIARLTTNQYVTRQGELLSARTTVHLAPEFNGQALEMRGTINGTVVDGKLVAHCRIESPLFPALEQELDPIPIISGSVFNPMQPIARLKVWPGQRWKIANFNPFTEAAASALRRLAAQFHIPIKIGGLFGATAAPTVFLAEVLREPQTLTQNDVTSLCHVVEYRSENESGRTWVQVGDGKVLRQEVTGAEKLVLIREN